jgi:hypothetical protein
MVRFMILPAGRADWLGPHSDNPASVLHQVWQILWGGCSEGKRILEKERPRTGHSSYLTKN